jgi:serine/threonine protein kinase
MMEYVPGVDLGRYVQDHGPLPWREACAYARQAALGLAHAHDRGVVHRDLKPRNLIRSEVDGSIKILDWGLARRLDRASPDEDARLTQPGSILGTRDYIAPEQIDDPAAAGPASDLYSLGCTLYELLTGRPPFRGAANKLLAHLKAPIPALPAELGIPQGVERLIRRLLAKPARDRYGSAREFVDALDAAVAAEEPGRPRPRIWRRAGLAAGLLGAVAILAVIAIDRRPGRDTGARDRSTQLDPGPVIQPPNGTASDPLPLSGELTVRVWTPDGRGKRGWKIEEPGTLPVLPGELVHLEARLNRPAYAYLLWLDGQGQVFSLYPWSDRTFESRPVREVALAEVHSPAKLSKGWPQNGPSGLETALLLVRRTPLPPGTDLAGLIGRLPSSALHDPQERAVFVFDSGQQPVEAIDRGEHRGLGEEAKQIDDALLQLLDRLRPHFELARAVRFAYRGE